jgi:hypothetical protein
MEKLNRDANIHKRSDDELVIWAELTSSRMGDKKAIQTVL